MLFDYIVNGLALICGITWFIYTMYLYNTKEQEKNKNFLTRSYLIEMKGLMYEGKYDEVEDIIDKLL